MDCMDFDWFIDLTILRYQCHVLGIEDEGILSINLNIHALIQYFILYPRTIITSFFFMFSSLQLYEERKYVHYYFEFF
jgi:hypothetical protein